MGDKTIKGLVSIIVPVYQVEEFLMQCMDSLINQTYRSCEFICINDGSLDKSDSILRGYAEKDNRIKIIEKENEGVSATRTLGLNLANGEYIMFVDADDWIDSDTVEKAVEKAISLNVDVVVWGYMSERKNKSIPRNIFDGNQYFTDNSDIQNLHRKLVGALGEELSQVERVDNLCTVWGKLYKKEIVSSVKFVDLNEIGTFEDGLFNLEVFGKVKSVYYINDHMYHYRRYNSYSQTYNYRPYLYNQWQNLFKKIESYIENNKLGYEYRQALQNRIALSVLGLGINVARFNGSIFERVRLLKVILHNEELQKAISNLKLSYLSFHWRLFYSLAKKRHVCTLLGLLFIINRIVSK